MSETNAVGVRSWAFARSTNEQEIERLFDYEPTYPIIGTERQNPSRISRQPSRILGKTGSCLRSYSAKADCWLWFHGAWLREAFQGTGSLRRHSAYNRGARSPSHGLAHHADRTLRRPRGPARGFRLA